MVTVEEDEELPEVDEAVLANISDDVCLIALLKCFFKAEEN